MSWAEFLDDNYFPLMLAMSVTAPLVVLGAGVYLGTLLGLSGSGVALFTAAFGFAFIGVCLWAVFGGYVKAIRPRAARS